MLTYNVYKIISRLHEPSYGLCAIAVSADSKKAAIKRFTGHYKKAEIIDVEVIEGRKPEWDQDRIEGTIDLSNPQKKPPSAGTRTADEIRSTNRQILSQIYKS